MSQEPPYEILKQTSCRVGQHAWIWAGTTTGPDDEPAPETLCSCGTFRWEELNSIRVAKGETPA